MQCLCVLVPSVQRQDYSGIQSSSLNDANGAKEALCVEMGKVPDDVREQEHKEEAEEVQVEEEQPCSHVQSDMKTVHEVRPMDSLKEQVTSVMNAPSWAEVFEFPHPEGEARKLTEEVLQTLMSSCSGTKEPKGFRYFGDRSGCHASWQGSTQYARLNCGFLSFPHAHSKVILPWIMVGLR